MLLTIINSLILITLSALAYIQSGLKKQPVDWLDILHAFVLIAGIVIGLIILVLVSNSAALSNTELQCALIKACVTSTAP